MIEETITKKMLIQKIEEARQSFGALLSTLARLQMIQPGMVGEWSVKDVVAHLTVWERMMVAWLADYLNEVPVVRPTSDVEFDEWNERIYLENKDKPLEEVLDAFESTHEMTQQALQETPDEELFEAGRYSYRGGLPLWQMVAGNTWWHYREHGEEIRAELHRSTK